MSIFHFEQRLEGSSLIRHMALGRVRVTHELPPASFIIGTTLPRSRFRRYSCFGPGRRQCPNEIANGPDDEVLLSGADRIKKGQTKKPVPFLLFHWTFRVSVPKPSSHHG